jgi:hypothetical protein
MGCYRTVLEKWEKGMFFNEFIFQPITLAPKYFSKNNIFFSKTRITFLLFSDKMMNPPCYNEALLLYNRRE